MSQEIEIEFKNLINHHVYQTLIDHYHSLRSPIFKQVNHYFDTNLYSLKKNSCALRVRFKDDQYVLTLKQPYHTGLLETHQYLNEKQFASLKNSGVVCSGEVHDQLSSLLCMPVPKLSYLGHLITERTEVKLTEGLLVLDKSHYFNRIDYEIEFECTEVESGRKAFNNLLNEWGLTWNQPANKIERFFLEKNRKGR